MYEVRKKIEETVDAVDYANVLPCMFTLILSVLHSKCHSIHAGTGSVFFTVALQGRQTKYEC